MSPPTKPATACIEDLPPEMISELFKYLYPKDLAACSMVNKRWHSIYAAFKLHRLVAIDRQDPPRKWYHSNKTIPAESVCHLKILPRLAEKPLLSNLKHLALWSLYDVEFDLNNLNRFTRLMHLEISLILGERKVHLNLSRLKVLAIHHPNHRCALSIDCPLLSTLLYVEEKENVNLLDVKHPETVRKLDSDLIVAKLTPFKSVECLMTWKFEAISKATLLSLSALRELRYNRNIESFFETQFVNGELITVDRMKRKLIEFLDEAKRLRGSDFRLIFSGFQLTNVNVDQIDFGVQVNEDGSEKASNEYVYMKNYHLIEPGALHFVDRIDYTRLLSNVTGEFPRCFSQKFTGIEEVAASDEVQDPEHFLWFLKSLRFLRSLVLANAKLSQTFYDQLPASARSLAIFELRESRKIELQLNFDFIGRLTHLSRLEIYDSPLSFESFPSFFRLIGRLRKVSFGVRLRDEDVEIYKDSTEWRVFHVGELKLVTEDPDEVVIRLERGIHSQSCTLL